MGEVEVLSSQSKPACVSKYIFVAIFLTSQSQLENFWKERLSCTSLEKFHSSAVYVIKL